MKSFPKILTIIFIAVFVLQMICLFFLLAAPVASQAATNIQFTPQVTIPGYTFDQNDKTTGNVANLIKAVYNYAIGIIGILAAIVLMIGGVLWIIAGGNTTQIGEAKAWIGAALTGLVLALTSYLILSTVNPALVELKTTGIQSVAEKKAETGLSATAASALNDELKRGYDNNVIFAPDVKLEGMKKEVAAGIAEVKKACNAYYSAVGCKITITGGVEKDSSGESFIVGNLSTGIGSNTLSDIFFNLPNQNITKVNEVTTLLKTTSRTYQLTKLPNNGGIKVMVLAASW